MARKSKSKKSKGGGLKDQLIKTEANGGSFYIEPGTYPMKIVDVTQEESSTGNDMIVAEFELTGGGKKIKGKTLKSWISCQEQALFKLKQLLVALELEDDDFPDSVEEAVEKLEEAKDEETEVAGVITDDEYQGRTRSKLDQFLPADEAEGEEEEEEETDKKGKNKKKGKKSGDDDDGKKGKGKKDKKKAKLDADEVKDMDEDELSDLNEEHELGVDLDDHKTLRKKAAAIIAALEENDLLEE